MWLSHNLHIGAAILLWVAGTFSTKNILYLYLYCPNAHRTIIIYYCTTKKGLPFLVQIWCPPVVLQHQWSKCLLHVAFGNDQSDTGPQLLHDGRPFLPSLLMLATGPKKIATGSLPCIHSKCPLPRDDVQLFHSVNALYKRFQRITIFTGDPQIP